MRLFFTRMATDWRVFATLLAILFGVFILTLPLATALQFGPDEGMELTKAFIYAKHSELTPQLWNDQPALFTEILSLAFKVFTPTILVARLVAVAFAVLFSISLWGIATGLAGEFAGLLAVIFFFLAPFVPSLIVSPMLELPAFSLALAAFWMLMAAYRKGSFRLLAGSALLYGCALNIKLTPAIMLPAICTYGCLTKFNRSPGHGKESQVQTKKAPLLALGALSPLAAWALAGCAIFLFLLWMIPPGIHWTLLWKSHANASNNYLFRTSPTYAFNPKELLFEHPDGVLGSIIGCYVLVFTRQWRVLVFLTVFVATVFTVHTFHRPWWSYYYLHFIIPMSLLSAIGLGALIKQAARLGGKTTAQGIRSLIALMALACLLMTMTTSALPRFCGQYVALRYVPRIENSALLKTIMLYKKQARWLYCLDAKYSFFSQIVSPPELAVLPVKRFYSGAISFGGILDYLRKYEPEEVLISTVSERDPDWTTFLERNYFKAYEKNGYALHISNKLAPQTAATLNSTNSPPEGRVPPPGVPPAAAIRTSPTISLPGGRVPDRN